MSVTSKLTLIVLILPLAVLIMANVLASFRLKISIDISTLISAILINLLVWERLRDAANKKLDYLHTNILTKLYKYFYAKIEFFYLNEIEKLRKDLERYGKYFLIPLYPRKLLKYLEEFVSYEQGFNEKLHKLREESSHYGLENTDLLLHFLGIKKLARTDAYDKNLVEVHEKRCSIILKKHRELIDEMKELRKESDARIDKIKKELECFMKQNTLKIPQLENPGIL